MVSYNMVMHHIIFNILFLILFSSPAMAEEGPPPLDFKGIYDFQFSGVPLARMGIEAEESAYGYSITSDITLEGIAKLFTSHSSHTTVEQTNGDRAYDSKYRTKKKKKAVRMVYKNGKMIEHKVEPPENPANRPAVHAALKNAAHDPLTLNLALRRSIWQALKSGKNDFSLTVFDGRRLTQIDASVAGRKKILIGEKEKPTIKLAVRRKLLEGYTKSELADYDPKEPTLWMYYSDDERLVPLKVEVGFLFGKITGTLSKECRTGESCLLGIKE
jgi:hypothetical protein